MKDRGRKSPTYCDLKNYCTVPRSEKDRITSRTTQLICAKKARWHKRAQGMFGTLAQSGRCLCSWFIQPHCERCRRSSSCRLQSSDTFFYREAPRRCTCQTLSKMADELTSGLTLKGRYSRHSYVVTGECCVIAFLWPLLSFFQRWPDFMVPV